MGKVHPGEGNVLPEGLGRFLGRITKAGWTKANCTNTLHP